MDWEIYILAFYYVFKNKIFFNLNDFGKYSQNLIKVLDNILFLNIFQWLSVEVPFAKLKFLRACFRSGPRLQF